MSAGLDLSIVIVSFNTRERTLECLASLRAAELGLDHEVIVVDNGSRDGTQAALRSQCPWVQMIALPANLGFAAGCNQGLLKAQGRHVLLLNSDTIVLRGALERCVEFLDRNPDVGVVGPQLLNPDRTRAHSIHNEPTLLQELVPPSLLRRLFPGRYPSRREVYQQPIDVEAVLGAALFARRLVLTRVGPLDEDYFFLLEETDWCRRIRASGWRIVHLPDACVIHLQGEASKRVAPLATRVEWYRSRYTFYRKNRTRSAQALLRVILLAKITLGCVFGGRRMRSYWHLLAWHLAGRPASWGLQSA